MAFGSDDLSDGGGSVNHSDSSNVKPMRCLADCGFFGSPQFQGYCSQCYVLCEIAKLTNTGQDHLSAAKVVKNDAETGEIVDEDGVGRNLENMEICEQQQPNEDLTTANNDTANSSEINYTTNDDMKGPCSNSDSAIQSVSMSTTNTPFPHINQKRSTENNGINADKNSDHQSYNTSSNPTENAAEPAKRVNDSQVAPSVVNESNPPEEPQAEQIQKDRTRCAKCNAKLRLTDMDCVCGLRFCRKHRFSEAHDCSFDYRNEHKRKLTKDIPKVAPRNIKDF